MNEEFQVTQATRKAVPVLVALAGTSGSGKTFSGLLLAAGIAQGDKVGMIDAENGRGTLYEDDPAIRAALPNGYSYVPIAPPYSPARYVMALRAMEAAGVHVCLIDSTSHEWEGEGGCTDIAENNKTRGGKENWALAKREHKKFLGYCLSSPMHIVFCLRARDKVKILADGKVVPQGIQPICEKNFTFEQLISLLFDETTHQYSGLKIPKMLTAIFRGGELITKEHGVAIRKWADGGAALGPAELLQKRARSAAELGMVEYSTFYASLPPGQKKALTDLGYHASNKAVAEKADMDGIDQRFVELESEERFYSVLGGLGYEDIKAIPIEKRPAVLQSIEAELKAA